MWVQGSTLGSNEVIVVKVEVDVISVAAVIPIVSILN